MSLQRPRTAVERQTQHDRRSDIADGADAHAAAVQFRQRLRDRKPETGSLIPFGELALDLLERPPEPGQRILGNADAAVLDHDHDAVGKEPRPYADATTLGRELHRI